MTIDANQIEGPLPEDKAAIARLRLLTNADLEAIEGLLGSCPVRVLAAGEILIQPGQVNRKLYLLLSGRLRVHLDSPQGRTICLLETGESVGELSVIDEQPTSAYVVAEADSRLLVVNHDIFWALVHASHAVASNMLVTLAQRLRRNNSTVSASLQLQQIYKRHATVDELTGLHNRRWLNNILQRQVTRSSKNQSALSVMMVDIDYFKRFNDKFGHAAGDQALHAVAQIMLHNVRPTDMLARYGGEEFVALLPDTDLAGAKMAAERIRRAVADAVIMMSDESLLPAVTISIGLAQRQPSMSVDALLAAADAALYRAKANGRNRYCD